MPVAQPPRVARRMTGSNPNDSSTTVRHYESNRGLSGRRSCHCNGIEPRKLQNTAILFKIFSTYSI